MASAWKSKSGLKQIAGFATFVIAAGSIPLAVGLFFTAHLIVPWVLGANYAHAVPLVRWMSPYIITASAASFLSSMLYATGRHRPYFFATLGGAVTGVVLYLALIPTIGLTGAALAFVLAELAVATIDYLSLPAELRALTSSPALGAAFFSSFLMVIAVRVANTYTTRPLIVVGAGALVYVISCGWLSRKWLIRELRGDTAPAGPAT
jgi:O-antigen/teichoic acid export membrane protein